MNAHLLRNWARATLGGLLFFAAACDPGSSTRIEEPDDDPAASTGRLSARHTTPSGTVTKGLSVQTVTASGRPFGMYVPTTYDATRAWPVTVLLHGYGGSGEGMAVDFQQYAEEAGLIVLAPNAYSPTWDLIFSTNVNGSGSFGVDRQFIDDMLKWAFAHINIDPARLSMSGFSDGATYALWLGLKNGDLFSRIAAFTPCTQGPNNRTGMPQVFISHGTDDRVFAIDTCARDAVTKLETAGYLVQFVEYASAEGNGHFMTPTVITQGMQFLAGN